MHHKLRFFVSLSLGGLLLLLAAGCTQSARKAYHLSRADKYFSAGEYDKAEIEYLKVIRSDQGNLQAFKRLGLLYTEQGRLPRAAYFLNRAKSLQETNLEIRLKLAQALVAVGALSNAQAEANYVLDRAPKDEEAPLLLADTALTTNQMAAARTRLDQLKQRAGETAGIDLALGSLSFKQRDLPAAGAAFNRALAIAPNSSAVLFALGGLYQAQNETNQAEQAYFKTAQLAPARSFRRLAYAAYELERGSLATATGAIDATLKQAPDYQPALLLAARIALAQRKYDEASSRLQKYLNREPVDFEAQMLQGALWFAQNRPDQALRSYTRVAGLYTNQPRAFFQLALSQLATTNANAAGISLKRAIALNPNYLEAILLKAQLDVRADPDASAAAMSKILDAIQRRSLNQPESLSVLAPLAAQAHSILAEARLAQGNPRQALAEYDQWAKLTPKDPRPHFQAGLVLLQQTNQTEARKELLQAAKLAPGEPRVVTMLVSMDLTDRQFQTAHDRIAAALQVNTNAIGLQLLEAEVCKTQGETNRAEGLLKTFIKDHPEVREGYYQLARLYVGANRQTQALAELKDAVAKDPKYAPAWLLMGMIEEEAKDYPAAAQAYEKCIAIVPPIGVALNNAAYLYAERLGNLDRAYELARMARERFPNDPATADTYGWVLFKRGEYSRALSALNESAEQLRDEPEVAFHQGMANYMLGNESAARLAFQRALMGKKDYQGRAEAQQRLAILNSDINTTSPATIAELKRRVSETPDDFIALMRLARIYDQTGAASEARDVYEQALRVNSNSVPVLIRLAQICAQRPDDVKRAKDLARAARNLAPNDATNTYLLGCLAVKTGESQWGLSLLKEAARAMPDRPDVLFDLGRATYDVGQGPEAEASVKRALQLNPTFPRADAAKRFLAAAALCANPAQLPQSAAPIQQALAAEPDLTPAQFANGLLLERQNNPDAARQAYEKLLARAPTFAPATRQLALLLSRTAKPDKDAYAVGVKAREAYPQDPEVAKALGILAYRIGDYPRSVQLLSESSGKLPTDAEVFYFLGMAQYQNRQKKESAASLGKSLSLNLKSPLREEVQRILPTLK